MPSKERVSVINTFKVAGHNKALLTVLMLTVLTQFSVMTIEPVLPLYIAQIGGSSSHTSMIAGFVFSIVGIASILFAARWGRLSDKIGFQKVADRSARRRNWIARPNPVQQHLGILGHPLCLRRLLLCRIPGTQRPCC